jgi:hypothetical protein
VRHPGTRLTSANCPDDTKETHSGQVEAGAAPGTPGSTARHRPEPKTDMKPKNRPKHKQ